MGGFFADGGGAGVRVGARAEEGAATEEAIVGASLGDGATVGSPLGGAATLGCSSASAADVALTGAAAA